VTYSRLHPTAIVDAAEVGGSPHELHFESQVLSCTSQVNGYLIGHERNNRATFEVLDWEPTPMETSFKDMAAAISA